MTPISHAPQRCRCGASLAQAPPWCPRCYLTTSGAPSSDPSSPGPTPPAAARAVDQRRWYSFRGSTLSYSLPGRLIATMLVTLPVLLFLKVLIPFGFVGVVAYGAVYPRALRDIWARR